MIDLSYLNLILKYLLPVCLLLPWQNPVFSQDINPDSMHVTRGIIEGNDTIAMVELEEVRIYSSSDFEYLSYKRRDRRLVRNVKKAYPYSRIAAIKLKELDEELSKLQSEAENKPSKANSKPTEVCRLDQESLLADAQRRYVAQCKTPDYRPSELLRNYRQQQLV